MRRWYCLPGIAAILLTALLVWSPWSAQAQPKAETRWIWFNEGKPASSAPAGRTTSAAFSSATWTPAAAIGFAPGDEPARL